MAGRMQPYTPLLVLVGPTAAGKSALALQIARQFNTDIISADSAQVYSRLDIGTAKPDLEEQKLVRHHLIDLVEPDQDFSVAQYQQAAYQTIEKVSREGKIPFLVGGTGLYIQAVVDRYAFGKKGKNERLREILHRQADSIGLDELYNRLKRLDPPAAAAIHPRDRRRIVRALEVFYTEGTPISRQVENTGQGPPFKALMLGLTLRRPVLYRRINERVDAMLEKGFLQEVESLLAAGFDPNCRGLQILGYRQLVEYLTGKKEWEQAIEEIKRETRRLAKRQLTWFRRDTRIRWLEPDETESAGRLVEKICYIVKDKLIEQANI